MTYQVESLFHTQIPHNKHLSLCLRKYGQNQYSVEWYDETIDKFYNPKYYKDLSLCYRDFHRILKNKVGFHGSK